MPARLSPEQAAERLQPSDTLGIPLGTGQPAGLIEALGERDDWEELRVYGELRSRVVPARESLAAIAHPDFREELLEAAERASGGRAPRTS